MLIRLRVRLTIHPSFQNALSPPHPFLGTVPSSPLSTCETTKLSARPKVMPFHHEPPTHSTHRSSSFGHVPLMNGTATTHMTAFVGDRMNFVNLRCGAGRGQVCNRRAVGPWPVREQSRHLYALCKSANVQLGPDVPKSWTPYIRTLR